MKIRKKPASAYRSKEKTGRPTWKRSQQLKQELAEKFIQGKIKFSRLKNTKNFTETELKNLSRQKIEKQRKK